MKFFIALILFCLTAYGQESASGEESAGSADAGSADAAPAEGEQKSSEEEEFFEVYEITTVSKKAEAVWEAPGVVSSMSAQQIEMYGDASVYDVMSRMVGVQNTFGIGINRTSVRGGEANASISHVLVLIDGRPVRASGGNISAYSPSYTFPVDSIERVEVSRGPASVLYGTNAFEGVINIVTKKGGKNGYTFSMEGGEFNTERMEFTTAYSTGDLMVNAGLMYHSTDGWPFTSASASDGTPFTKDIFQDNKGVNARIGYKDWTLSVTHGNMKQAAFLSLEDGDPLSFDSQVTVVDLGYNLLVGAWSIDFHATQNHEVFDWVIQEPVFPLYTNDWLGEVTAYGYLGNVNITLGGVVQRLRTGTNGGVVSTPYEGVNWVYSTYAQGQYNPRDNLEFTFGFQLNKPDTVDEIDFVPRLGAVWTFDTGSSMTKSGLKFLYGEAFRSPSLLERTINTPGIQLGNPDLKPESIATFDLQLFNYTANYETSLTVYRSEQTDLIALVPSDEYFIGEYRNVAKLVSEGVELEAKYMPNDNWYIQGSYSWQESEEKTGLANSSLAPNSNWKVGVGYTSPIFKGSLFNQHDGAYQEIPGANVINPASEAVDLVSLNLSMDLGGLMPLAGVNRYNVYLRGTNLLDEEIWVPDFLTRANNTVPGGPGRSVYAGLKFGF